MEAHRRVLSAVVAALWTALPFWPVPVQAASNDASAIARFLSIGFVNSASGFSAIRGRKLEQPDWASIFLALKWPDRTLFQYCHVVRLTAALDPDEYTCRSTLRSEKSLAPLFNLATTAVRTNLPPGYTIEDSFRDPSFSMWQTWAKPGQPHVRVNTDFEKGKAYYELTIRAAEPAGARAAAMHSILSFAVSGAQRQFRDVGNAPSAARKIFDYCQVPPRQKYEEAFAGRPIFECQDSDREVFKSRSDFAGAVREPLPAGFTRAVSCPDHYDGYSYLKCLQSSNGTEVRLLEEGVDKTLIKNWTVFSIFVLAPPLSQQTRLRARAEAAAILRALLRDMNETAAKGFGEADASRFAAQHATVVKECRVGRPPTGRPILICTLRVLTSIDKADLIAGVHTALPIGFHPSKCVEVSSASEALSPVCERNGQAVEVRFGEGLNIEADDTAYPPSPEVTMREFLSIVLPAAARNFQGFDAKQELPYFGPCTVESPTDNGGRRYLACEPDGSAMNFDLHRLIGRALASGYKASDCTVDYFSFLAPMEAAGGCFGAGTKPEIDVFEYQGLWFLHLGLPSPREP